MKQTIKRLIAPPTAGRLGGAGRTVIALALMLLTMTAQTAMADITGSGTQSDPYVLSDAADWATFAANVNGGTNADKFYKLSDSWNNSSSAVTATVGTSDHPFTGRFDGNSKTLTVNISETSTQGTAPFRYISGGAVIRNVTVAGSVTGTTHAAGLVGFSKDGSAESPNTIDGCTVSASVSGGSHNGGVVGHGLNSYLKIKNTVFSGNINNGSSYTGGLQGWSDDNHLTLDNCIFKGSYSGSGSFHPIAIHNSGSTTTATVSATYYTAAPTLTNTAYIAAAGAQVSTAVPSGVVYGTVTAADNQTYYAPVTVSGIYNHYLYTGNSIAIDYTVTAANGTALTKGTHYTENVSPSTVQAKGDYTLTITGQSPYNGSQTFNFTVDDGIPVTSGTTTMTTGIYIVTENLTISSRVTISGDVKLILGEGTTLTASKGIELSSGNKLTIEGSGTLTATSDNTIEKSGIGAKNFGTLIINGGHVNATGYLGAAGIGTEAGGTDGGTIIINGGMVTAIGGHCSAGIGGCYRPSSIKSAPAGNIIINGGQVHATGMIGSGQNDGIGIGNGWGQSAGNGSLTLGWTAQTDFIYAQSYSITNISFAEGKTFFLEGTSTVATKENIGGKKIVPPTGEILKNLEFAALSGIEQRYLYTGNTISLGYTLTAGGENLTKGTHFTETLTLGGNTVSEVKKKGTYTLTLTGVNPYTGSKSVNFTVLSEETFGGYAFTFAADDEGNYFAVDKKEALTALASYVNGGSNASGLRFKQTADIDMQGVSYTPIGKGESIPFSGIYDGDGYVILNINYSNYSDKSGMFGEITNGTVKNVNLKDCSFSGNFAGGISVIMSGSTIDNCTVIGGTVSCGNNGSSGGIVGIFISGTVKDCFTTTTVSAYSAQTGMNGPIVGLGNDDNPPANSYYTNSVSGGNSVGTQIAGGFITTGEGVSITDGIFRTIGKTAANTYRFGKSGDAVTLSAPPAAGYMASFSSSDVTITDGTFTMPAKDVTVTATWYDLAPFGYNDDPQVDGSAEHPYIISTAEGWELFCDMLEGGESFTDKTVKLEANIGTAENPVICKAGSTGHEFAGTFDGQGKTLYVNITGTVQGTAPFCEIKGATIRNLVVTGSVAGKRHSAGLVGFARGDASVENTIENCLVATDVSIKDDDRGYLGGIVGHGLQCKLTIRGCAFTGSLTSESYYTGGLQGWSDGNTLILTDDLFAPTSVSAANVGFHPIAIHANNATTTATVSNVYYTVEPTCTTASRIATTSAPEQPKQAYVYTPANIGFVPANVGEATGNTYDVSDITLYESGMKQNGKFYLVKGSVSLADDAVNDIALIDKLVADVTFSNRTLYKDGSWNTLCLPFDLTLSGSVLDGDNVELMTLGDASFSQGTLSLSFVVADEIKAGKPYIIRWNNTGSHIVNPVFKGVTIVNASLDENAVTINDVISFKGIYSPFEIPEANNKLLYLGDGDQLYYPSTAMAINAFRAYFELQGDLVCGEPSSTENGINAFVLNFDGETSFIDHLPLTIDHSDGAWYSIDGRKLSGKPTAKGIYINNGKKFVIK